MNMNVFRCFRLLVLSALTMLCLNTMAQEKVPQIPLSACDSMVVKNLTDRYGVVYKNGKCGIYDFQKEENVRLSCCIERDYGDEDGFGVEPDVYLCGAVGEDGYFIKLLYVE